MIKKKHLIILIISIITCICVATVYGKDDSPGSDSTDLKAGDYNPVVDTTQLIYNEQAHVFVNGSTPNASDTCISTNTTCTNGREPELVCSIIGVDYDTSSDCNMSTIQSVHAPCLVGASNYRIAVNGFAVGDMGGGAECPGYRGITYNCAIYCVEASVANSMCSDISHSTSC